MNNSEFNFDPINTAMSEEYHSEEYQMGADPTMDSYLNLLEGGRRLRQQQLQEEAGYISDEEEAFENYLQLMGGSRTPANPPVLPEQEGGALTDDFGMEPIDTQMSAEWSAELKQQAQERLAQEGGAWWNRKKEQKPETQAVPITPIPTAQTEAMPLKQAETGSEKRLDYVPMIPEEGFGADIGSGRSRNEWSYIDPETGKPTGDPSFRAEHIQEQTNKGSVVMALTSTFLDQHMQSCEKKKCYDTTFDWQGNASDPVYQAQLTSLIKLWESSRDQAESAWGKTRLFNLRAVAPSEASDCKLIVSQATFDLFNQSMLNDFQRRETKVMNLYHKMYELLKAELMVVMKVPYLEIQKITQQILGEAVVGISDAAGEPITNKVGLLNAQKYIKGHLDDVKKRLGQLSKEMTKYDDFRKALFQYYDVLMGRPYPGDAKADMMMGIEITDNILELTQALKDVTARARGKYDESMSSSATPEAGPGKRYHTMPEVKLYKLSADGSYDEVTLKNVYFKMDHTKAKLKRRSFNLRTRRNRKLRIPIQDICVMLEDAGRNVVSLTPKGYQFGDQTAVISQINALRHSVAAEFKDPMVPATTGQAVPVPPPVVESATPVPPPTSTPTAPMYPGVAPPTPAIPVAPTGWNYSDASLATHGVHTYIHPQTGHNFFWDATRGWNNGTSALASAPWELEAGPTPLPFPQPPAGSEWTYQGQDPESGYHKFEDGRSNTFYWDAHTGWDNPYSRVRSAPWGSQAGGARSYSSTSSHPIDTQVGGFSSSQFGPNDGRLDSDIRSVNTPQTAGSIFYPSTTPTKNNKKTRQTKKTKKLSDRQKSESVRSRQFRKRSRAE